MKRFLNSEKGKNDQKQWYYVHIFSNDLSKVQKCINLQIGDQIVKNSFILYLSEAQLKLISPYSLVKLIEPSEKIDLISPYKDTNYFNVKTAPNYDLTPIDDLFTIDLINSDNSYIIRVDQNELKNSEFILK